MYANIQRAWELVIQDDPEAILLRRVTCLLVGTLLLGMACAALAGFFKASGAWLLIFWTPVGLLGLYYFYVGLFGSRRKLNSWMLGGYDGTGLLVVLGVVFLAIPITIIIKTFQPRTRAKKSPNR